MRKVLGLLLLLVAVSGTWAQERQDTIVVSRDGTGNFRTLQEAIESARAFMDYTVTIYVRNGVYKEKVIVPSWVENIDIIGEDRDKTIITYDDHANINKMGTFRTYTVKVEGSDITFKNLTIENNAAQLGQAVALHTEGDRLKFINCRILGSHTDHSATNDHHYINICNLCPGNRMKAYAHRFDQCTVLSLIHI